MHPVCKSVLAVQVIVEESHGVLKLNCSMATVFPAVPSLRITYILVPSGLNSMACGLSITSELPPS